MSKLKKILFLLGALFTATVSIAQKGTQSPYSVFGLGERNTEGFATFSSMGGTSMGNTDSSIVNTSNPASYAYIARNMPIFQIGLNGKLSNFSTAQGSSNQRHFGLNQFQLGLPIAKNLGIGLGIKPYTFKGYTVTDYTLSGEDTTMLSVNEGSGGVRIANFGIAYRPINSVKKATLTLQINSVDTTVNKKMNFDLNGTRINRLSVGFNANYLFGTSSQIRSAEEYPFEPLSPFYNGRVIDGVRVSGLSTELGVNYQYGFQSAEVTRIISVGATYSPQTEIKAFQDLYSFSYRGSFYGGQSVIVSDTIEFIQDNQGAVLSPERYAVGLEYRLSPYKSNSLIKIGADFKMEKWSKFYTEFSDVKNNGGLKDRMTASVGLEWTPSSGQSAFNVNSNFFSRAHYRLGFNFTQTELLVRNNLGNEVGINNYGMSFGLGIPILTGNSNTNINFGASLGNLGTTENGLIREQYTGIYVGLSITPQASNRWFVKRKYN